MLHQHFDPGVVAPMPVSDAKLDRIEQLARAATPGPWKAYQPDVAAGEDDGWWWVWKDTASPYYQAVGQINREPDTSDEDYTQSIIEMNATDGNDIGQERIDAEYIAAVSPPVVLALIQELRKARAMNDLLAAANRSEE